MRGVFLHARAPGFQLATYCLEKYPTQLKNYLPHPTFPPKNAGIHQEVRVVPCEQFTFAEYHMAAGRRMLTCFHSTAGLGPLFAVQMALIDIPPKTGLRHSGRIIRVISY